MPPSRKSTARVQGSCAIPTDAVRFALAIIGLLAPLQIAAQVPDAVPVEEYARARVLRVLLERDDPYAGFRRTVQTVELALESGPESGTMLTIENGVLENRADMKLAEGQRIIVRSVRHADGKVQYFTAETYRLPSLAWLLVGFAVLAFALGGWTSVRSLGGLVFSIGILAMIVVPRIAAGANPVAVSLLGACVIACVSLTMAHGWSRRTQVALLSTLITLAIAALLAWIAVSVGRLFGMGTEESVLLQLGPLPAGNLRGVLLGGIIIGCLGVLDDVTTAQCAAVDEIRKADPRTHPSRLWNAGMSVGREHIASLINTLALAYVGASLPLFLLFQLNATTPWWVTLNSEFFAEEIIRTLVGSAALLIAVPVSTFFAVLFLHGSGGPRHACVHHSHHD